MKASSSSSGHTRALSETDSSQSVVAPNAKSSSASSPPPPTSSSTSSSLSPSSSSSSHLSTSAPSPINSASSALLHPSPQSSSLVKNQPQTLQHSSAHATPSALLDITLHPHHHHNQHHRQTQQQHRDPHKRQRSPQALAFARSLPTPVGNGQIRPKRARHLSVDWTGGENKSMNMSEEEQDRGRECKVHQEREPLGQESGSLSCAPNKMPGTDQDSNSHQSCHELAPRPHPQALAQQQQKQSVVPHSQGHSVPSSPEEQKYHSQPQHQHPPQQQQQHHQQPHSHPQQQQQQQQSHRLQYPSQPLSLPITRDTLRELELFEIFKNPQLRHDVVFDPNLQFRPNFDGERGQIKRREADRFWSEVERELNARQSAASAKQKTNGTGAALQAFPTTSLPKTMSNFRTTMSLPVQQAQTPSTRQAATTDVLGANLLPRLISELREILLSLLPAPSPAGPNSAQTPVNPERQTLISTLDPDLLLQELDHGVLNVYPLFRFLGDTLKGHCAPMRDALVEAMVSVVVNSNEIARGIRMCFEILEWMKLDIANHQLRTLRPWLLENSVDFEQKYFTEHLNHGGSLQRTQEWFKLAWIQWEGVKGLVIGKQATLTVPSTPTGSAVSSRRPSLVSSFSFPMTNNGTVQTTTPAASPIAALNAASTGSTLPYPSMDAKAKKAHLTISTNLPISTSWSGNLSPAPISAGMKRRSSIARADVGENILDGAVNEGLLEMILRPHTSIETLPETFELDHYRLLSFHNDFQDLTILCILLILFRQRAQSCWTAQDLVEIKKVVWLLLTDENTHFGNNPGSSSASGSSNSGSNGGGMKDIVIQIEFAARKVRDRSQLERRRSSLSGAQTPTTGTPPIFPTSSSSSSISSLTLSTSSNSISAMPAASGKLSHTPMLTPPRTPSTSGSTGSMALPIPSLSQVSPLSAADTNLLTSWLDSALCPTSVLYRMVQKRLLIHFRRWLYLHSSSSMMVLSSSCASLASAMSSLANNQGGVAMDSGHECASTLAERVQNGHVDSSDPSDPEKQQQDEEALHQAAVEALAAKLSFNSVEMESHGLTGLEDEMMTLLNKIRAVAEFNKKVYSSWYRDLVRKGRQEQWLVPNPTPMVRSTHSATPAGVFVSGTLLMPASFGAKAQVPSAPSSRSEAKGEIEGPAKEPNASPSSTSSSASSSSRSSTSASTSELSSATTPSESSTSSDSSPPSNPSTSLSTN